MKKREKVTHNLTPRRMREKHSKPDHQLGLTPSNHTTTAQIHPYSQNSMPKYNIGNNNKLKVNCH